MECAFVGYFADLSGKTCSFDCDDTTPPSPPECAVTCFEDGVDKCVETN